MAGFGLQPAGTTSGGFGTPPTAPTLTGKPLQNPVSGNVEGSRYIDAATKDYRLNEDNRLAGMSNTQQLVHLAMHTEESSSAIRELGNTLRDIEIIGPNFERQVLTIVERALAQLIRDGYIKTLGFSRFEIGPNGRLLPGASIGFYRYVDLTTNQEQRVPV